MNLFCFRVINPEKKIRSIPSKVPHSIKNPYNINWSEENKLLLFIKNELGKLLDGLIQIIL